MFTEMSSQRENIQFVKTYVSRNVMILPITVTSCFQAFQHLYITNLEALAFIAGVAAFDASDHPAIPVCTKKVYNVACTVILGTSDKTTQPFVQSHQYLGQPY